VTAFPATDSVPVRAAPVFVAALNVTDAGPKLCASDVIVNHAALLVALHSHPAIVSSDIVAPPPVAATDAAVGVTEYTHAVLGGGSASFASCEIRTV
jgi:hypothetical protein